MSTKLFGAALLAGAMITPGIALAQINFDRFMAADANHDGAISRPEMEQGRVALFNRVDSNHDDSISAAEREAARGQIQTQAGAAGLDADNNGAISRAEFMDRPYPAFDRFDADHNNVLDANELATIRARATELMDRR